LIPYGFTYKLASPVVPKPNMSRLRIYTIFYVLFLSVSSLASNGMLLSFKNRYTALDGWDKRSK